MTELPFYTSLLVATSPIFVALIRNQAWAAGRVALLAVGWVAIAYVGGQYLDGQLAFDQAHLAGFVAALVSQQAVYQLIQNTAWFQWLEAVGNPRGLAGQPRAGDQGW